MSSQHRGKGSARVLVIDDDEVVLEVLRDLLESHGYTVHTMASPIGATRLIVSERIEAVVVDLNMPVMQGDRFIALVRSWDKISDIPTVLISGESAEQLDQATVGLPGVSKISKSTMHRTLPEALSRVLAHTRSAPGARGRLGGRGSL